MRLGCVRLGRILVAELIGFNEAEAHAPRMHFRGWSCWDSHWELQ